LFVPLPLRRHVSGSSHVNCSIGLLSLFLHGSTSRGPLCSSMGSTVFLIEFPPPSNQRADVKGFIFRFPDVFLLCPFFRLFVVYLSFGVGFLPEPQHGCLSPQMFAVTRLNEAMSMFLLTRLFFSSLDVPPTLFSAPGLYGPLTPIDQSVCFLFLCISWLPDSPVPLWPVIHKPLSVHFPLKDSDPLPKLFSPRLFLPAFALSPF